MRRCRATLGRLALRRGHFEPPYVRALLDGGGFDCQEQLQQAQLRLTVPPLHERREDIPPNLEFQLEQVSRAVGVNVTMNKEAKARFLEFSATWTWPGNFRDFDAAITRMATLAEGGRITAKVVDDELERLQVSGAASNGGTAGELVTQVLGSERAARLDRFDRVQLQDVLAVCKAARSLSAAGRELFAASRSEKASVNDADRLRKYLARFEIDFAELKRA